MTYKDQDYTLIELNDEYFILPFGQATEDLKSGYAVDESTAVLWRLLDETDDPDLLTRRFCEEFSIEEYDHEAIKESINNALFNMKKMGFLHDPITFTILEPVAFNVIIAGVPIQLRGNKELFHNSLLPFKTDDDSFELSFNVTYRSPVTRPVGTIIMRNNEMALFESDDEYIFLFLNTTELKEARISNDMKRTTVYCNSPVTEIGKEIILNTLRYVFLTYVSSQNLYAIHSVSVLYRDKAWLFSGSSGTGKTTHTNMWKRLFNTEIINGDLNLIGIKDGIPTIYGVPWCGSSNTFTTKDYPLGGVVLLKQNKNNFIEHLKKNDQILSLSQRMINAHTDPQQLKHSLAFLNKLVDQIYVFRLHFNMDDEAAEICKKEIDMKGY